MAGKVRLAIDTDPGIDDAMAILYAVAAPEIEIAALTTVFGNVRVDQATRNALRLLDWAGLDARVAEGAGAPSVLPPFAPSAHVHGAEGFGDIPAETPPGAAMRESAAEATVRMAGEGAALVPVGPLTNVAAALALDPALTARAGGCVVMGGAAFVPGNITPHAEANIYHDPHAAARVFAAEGVRMVGLDVTNRILCTRDDFAAVAEAAPRLGGKLAQMADFYIRFYEGFGLTGCALHDPAAVIAATHPHLFDWHPTPLTVICEGEEAGRTVPGGDGPDVLVAREVDAEAVKTLFLERLMTLD